MSNCPDCNVPMTDMGQWPAAQRLRYKGLWSKPEMYQAWRCEQCKELFKFRIYDEAGRNLETEA